ncbi:hypothetical protein ASF70_13100 [Rhizobium sp. Leaf321]|uniref:hypothetical protein n=1 Tax=Rhizobium sp. Leaf321 TaxID=1736335 RepID=UPI000713444B|nr:hypothetical protein [Rhizobium sp. Leaf321]KQQ72458.1 hypothetical protein ASF70_13100 [Rhizobium sp. Leaf321]
MKNEIHELVCDAVFRYADLLHAAGLTSIVGPPEEIGEAIGRILIRQVGTPFRLGRQILTALSPDGYLLPPPEFRLHRQHPPPPMREDAPELDPWSAILWQTGHVPAIWQLGGTLRHTDGFEERRWFRLLHIDVGHGWARTDEGWLRLGERMHS